MANRNIVVIGGSFDGLEVIRTILSGLTGRFPASVFVVLHSSPDSPGILDRILSRSTTMTVRYAVDREPIRGGRVYVAPVDRHLLVKLEEHSELLRRMADHARTRGMAAIASSYEQQARDSEQRALTIRRVLMPEGPETDSDLPVADAADEPTASGKTK